MDDRTGQSIPSNIHINGALFHQKVIYIQVTIPLTAATELAVTTPGNQPWSLRFGASRAGTTPTGRIRLTPLE